MTSVAALNVSYLRARRADGLSPATIALYRDVLRRLVLHMERETGCDEIDGLTHRLLSGWFSERMEQVKPITVWTDFKSVRRYTRWLCDEQELTVDPMARIKAPRVIVRPIPILSDEELRRLVAACSGSDRRARRDLAVMRLLIEGFRRGEIVGLVPADIDLDAGLATVTGKGRSRTVAIGAKTCAAIDRWLRLRPAGSGTLFRLTPSGLYQATTARAAAAGIDGWHPHRMRHTAAHRFLAAGGQEHDLLQTLGWTSGAMLRRYGASAASARARAAQRSLGLADRV